MADMSFVCEIVTKKWCVGILHPRSRHYFNNLSPIYGVPIPQSSPKCSPKYFCVTWGTVSVTHIPFEELGGVPVTQTILRNLAAFLLPKCFWGTWGNFPVPQMPFEEHGELFLFPKCLLRIMGNCSCSPTCLGNMGTVPQSSQEHVSMAQTLKQLAQRLQQPT